MIKNIGKLKLAIIGLGYVGLPLALEFAKKRQLIGFDIDKKRIKELNSGLDKNLEITKKELKNIKKLFFTSDRKKLKTANCYIITVPTPVDESKKPNLEPLLTASKIVSKVIKKKDIIIYESTVYPGCVEEKCVPVLEKYSKLKFNQDFFCGYSPERINSADKKHTIKNTKRITSGSTPKIASLVDDLYNEIVTAGTHKASSIKIAEAAKVIENTQRDLNIALINELSILFSKMNIDTEAVLDAAGSKWNFLPFKPGLVGGHCIGVDPYYLMHKARNIGYHPKVISAGRELNDKMGDHVVSQLITKMKKKNIQIKKSKILIMGLTYKENCADVRNSGIKNVIEGLKRLDCNLDLFDPWADGKEINKTYNINLISELSQNYYQGIIIAVAHDKFKSMGIENISKLCKKKHVIYDLKHIFPRDLVDLRL